MAKFIEFQEVMPHPGGVWLIANKKAPTKPIGYIEWYGPWKQYVAQFHTAIWSHDCLTDVAEFMRKIGT